MHVIGTAGHVDHGKSALVRALTGTDPDRWIEEKLRGMTLDLGFARLRFDDGTEAGIVDVPGHERFLHNMLAGAAGMELLLLVVAANEGPRPQTVEHLAILSYLNVRSVIVALTKSDLVDSAELSLVRDLVSDATRGTVAEGAQIIPVSTVTSDGLADLREAIHRELWGLPSRAPEAPAYLPIDRVFALPGRGTIVTGTLMQGRISVNETLRLAPLDREVRIRSLQVFGENKEMATGGSRVAVNLPGVATDEVTRGAVLGSSQFAPQQSFRVSFLPYEPALPLLRRRTQVRTYIGSAEILGTLQFDAVPTSKESVVAHLHLRHATIGLPEATFVLRRLSPKELLGGGTLMGRAAAESDATATERRDAMTTRVVSALREAGVAGASPANLGAAANVREDLAIETLSSLQDAGRAFRLARPDAYVDVDIVSGLEARVTETLKRNEADAPWMIGTTALALSRELGVPEAQLLRILVLLADEGRIASRAGYYSTIAFTPELTDEQRAFFDRELHVDPTQPYLPVSLGELVTHIKAARMPGLSQAFDTLVATGAAVKVGESVYRSTQIAEVRRKLVDSLRKNRQITAAAFRDIVGTSRKYAVPLLEWFDATGVTVRSGDFRMLRQRTAGK